MVRTPTCLPADDEHTVPVVVRGEALPISEAEAEIVARFDGLRTLAEVARECRTSITSVRSLILQLAFLGAVQLDELTEVDELDCFSLEETGERRSSRTTVLPEEPILLTRRKRAPGFVRLPNDSPLVAAVLSALSALDRSDD